MVGAPQIDALVLRARGYIPTIRGEASLDLTRHVGVPLQQGGAQHRDNLHKRGHLVLADEAEVAEVVEADAAVVAGDEDPVLAGHGLDARHLAAAAVLAAGALHVDGGVVLQLVGREEDHPPVIRTHHHKLAWDVAKQLTK